MTLEQLIKKEVKRLRGLAELYAADGAKNLAHTKNKNADYLERFLSDERLTTKCSALPPLPKPSGPRVFRYGGGRSIAILYASVFLALVSAMAVTFIIITPGF